MIDHTKIAAAEAYYEAAGFKKIDVPWVVCREAYEATFPEGSFPFFTLGGFLPASGEQSFLHLILNNELSEGRYQCTTPCFRDEAYDELHLPYFYKVELIEITNQPTSFMELAYIALGFFTGYCKTKYQYFPYEQTDIVEHYTGIELGSYGRRHYKGLMWNYGTGLAEPRLSQVLAKILPNQ
ncbi:MAG: hypothetical protein U0516_01905 [Candidatus Saccharibacteria bacterium]